MITIAGIAGVVIWDTMQGSEEKTVIPEDTAGTLVLTIGGTEVEVEWEDNYSVLALRTIAENGIDIDTHRYGGFEQVGSIGSRLPSEDARITTDPGDIVLYSSNQMVVFFGSNTWEYTRLGKIVSPAGDGLTGLLDVPGTVLHLSLK